MNIFKTKIWIPAIILMIVLITATVVIIVLWGKVYQLKDEVSHLNNLITVEKQSNDNALTDIEAVKAENDTLRAENDILSADIEMLRQYQLTFDVPNGFEVAIDQRLEPELVALIKKHFDAIAAGNIDEYQSTLGNPENEYLLGIFESRKNTSVDITSISALVLNAGIIQNGGFFLAVSYKSEGKVTLYADIGVTKREDKWVICDYD